MKIIGQFILSLFIWLPLAQAATPGEVMQGQYLRDVTMMGLGLPDKALSEYQGKPLIINIWASWCGPCRAEMQSLESLSKQSLAVEFNLIGISTDDFPLKAYALIDETDISFDNFIDQKLVLENMLGANRIPLTILVDAEGKVLAKVHGSRAWDHPKMVKMIEQTFQQKELITTEH
ncbi:MAG: TlpA disulfide reductase family protein [Enterobacterales bacterium]|nr:TlpA disulfide reductase family protein [Enterobacterales bacterium]